MTDTNKNAANLMKPQTAAKKLRIYLPATPEEFRSTPLTHAQFVELQKNPPEWLQELRRNGPHPRDEVARRLGVTISALRRHHCEQPLTTAEIKELLVNRPEWLSAERAITAENRETNARS